LRYHPKPRRPRTSKASKTNTYFIKKLPGTLHESSGAKDF